MEDDYGVRTVVLDDKGNFLCFSKDGKIVSLPLEEIKLENLFKFWSKDLDELKNFFYNSGSFLVPNIDNIDSFSFLDLYEYEDGDFSIG